MHRVRICNPFWGGEATHRSHEIYAQPLGLTTEWRLKYTITL